MAITDYRINSKNNNSQQQPIIGYRQTSKLLPRACKSTDKSKNHHKRNKLYMYQFKCVNTMPTVLHMSNGLICGCTAVIHSCLWTKEASYHMEFATIHWNCINIISYIIYQLFDDYIIMLLIILNLH